LAEFANYLSAAPADEKAEWVVRTMLGKVAQNCPMGVLLQLGQCLIDCRRSELRGEAEQN
jgi:hypothetical protein